MIPVSGCTSWIARFRIHARDGFPYTGIRRPRFPPDVFRTPSRMAYVELRVRWYRSWQSSDAIEGAYTTSATTPMISALASRLLKLLPLPNQTRFPSGSSSGQNCRAALSLITVTLGASAPSPAVNTRPRRTGIPSVTKWSGAM